MRIKNITHSFTAHTRAAKTFISEIITSDVEIKDNGISSQLQNDVCISCLSSAKYNVAEHKRLLTITILIMMKMMAIMIIIIFATLVHLLSTKLLITCISL